MENTKIASSANIVKQSVILGDVTIGEDSTVLFHAVLRGDCAEIIVGRCSNIQDNCTVPDRKGMSDRSRQCSPGGFRDTGRQSCGGKPCKSKKAAYR